MVIQHLVRDMELLVLTKLYLLRLKPLMLIYLLSRAQLWQDISLMVICYPLSSSWLEMYKYILIGKYELSSEIVVTSIQLQLQRNQPKAPPLRVCKGTYFKTQLPQPANEIQFLTVWGGV